MLAWAASSIVMSIPSASAATGDWASKVDGECPGSHPVEVVHGGCGIASAVLACPEGGGKYIKDEGPEDCKKAEGEAGAGESITAKKALESFLSIVLAAEGVLNRLLWPVLFLIGGLINNDILFGSGMEERLYDIWVPIRNIVNIGFVLALVGLALYSVLGINGENSQFSIKTLLPKLIAGIIAVNFSFLVVKVFLDTINVFTTAIFSIPNQVSETLKTPILDNASESPTMEKTIAHFCKQMYASSGSAGTPQEKLKQGIEDVAYLKLREKYKIPKFEVKEIKSLVLLMEEEKQDAFNAEKDALIKAKAFCEYDDSKKKFMLTDPGQDYFAEYGSNNASLALAINMGNILFANDVSSTIGSNTYESFAINVIFSLLLYIVYAASFVALFAVLLARLVVMWLGLAFSPIIALSIAVPMAKDKLGLGELTQKFVAHAMAPITIAMSMTVGWIMLNAIKSTVATQNTSVIGASDALIPVVPIPGLETLQGLLVTLATVAVVWIGVFTAANKTIAGKFTDFMKGKLEQFGGWVATAPFKYIPWVPVEIKDGETESYSPASIWHAGELLQDNLTRKSKNKFAEDMGLKEKGYTTPGDINDNMSRDDIVRTFQNSSAEDLAEKAGPRMKGRGGNFYKAIKEMKEKPGEEGRLGRLLDEARMKGEISKEQAKVMKKLAGGLSTTAVATTPEKKTVAEGESAGANKTLKELGYGREKDKKDSDKKTQMEAALKVYKSHEMGVVAAGEGTEYSQKIEMNKLVAERRKLETKDGEDLSQKQALEMVTRKIKETMPEDKQEERIAVATRLHKKAWEEGEGGGPTATPLLPTAGGGQPSGPVAGGQGPGGQAAGQGAGTGVAALVEEPAPAPAEEAAEETDNIGDQSGWINNPPKGDGQDSQELS